MWWLNEMICSLEKLRASSRAGMDLGKPGPATLPIAILLLEGKY
jgi:hypothetical protein